MALIEWKDEYNINVEDIDKQHQFLFNQLNSIEGIGEDEAGYKKLGEVIKSMVEYTQYHFTEEEKLMDQINFSEYEQHKVLHKNLVKQVVGVLIRLKKGKEVNRDDMIKFLSSWLIEHIEREDAKIGSAVALYKKASATV